MNLDAKSRRLMPLVRCPACATMTDRPRCPSCGIWLAGDEAAELRWIEGELRRIDAARMWLFDRRAALLAELARVPADCPSHQETSERVARDTDLARPELSRHTVGRLLLATGAVLVLIATTAFTAASWGAIGPLGRCAILLAVTACALTAAAWLRRRNLTATAETVAGIGLALTAADAYLLGQLFPAMGLFALAATCAVLAALWAAYGLAAKLATPLLAAIVAAQFPGVIATIALARALGGTVGGPTAVALLVTSAADLQFGGWMSRRAHRALALTSSIVATVTWVVAMLLAAAPALVLHVRLHDAVWMSATFLIAGVIGVVLVPRSAVSWLPVAPVAVLSGGLLAIGSSIPAADMLHAGWVIVAFALAGVVVAGCGLMLARVIQSRDARLDAERFPAATARLRLVAAGSAAITCAAGLIELPAAVSAMFPLEPLTDVWSGPKFPSGAYVVGYSAAALAPVVVLGLASLACWAAPLQRRSWLRAVALAVASLAAGSVPSAGLTGWAALFTLTVAAALMLGASTMSQSADRGRLALGAAGGGVALAVSAVLSSLTWAAATIIELAVLTVIFCLVSAAATAVGQLATGCAVAAAAGLACTGPLASGWPVRYAAFAALGVAVGATGVATLVRRARPRHADVLDVGAGLVSLLAAVLAVRQASTFAAVAAITALGASSIGWLRSGRQKAFALSCAVFALLAAIAAQVRPLALALARPYAQLATPWHGPPHAAVPGLATALIVAGTCVVALMTAAGAWRGGRASLDALAVALPIVVAPAGLAGGLGYELMTCLLLVLALVLTAWAAISRSLAPAGAALAAATLALAWALAAPVPTLTVLGSLATGYALCAWRAQRAGVQAALACLSVLSTTGLGEAAALAAGWPAWRAGLLVLGVAACALLAASLLRGAGPRGERLNDYSALTGFDNAPLAGSAIEAAAWFAVAAGSIQYLLVAADVGAPEPYAVPTAAAWIAYGWHLSRRRPQLSSWATYGPGLGLVLLPSLITVWHDPGWIRALWLGLLATAITLIGGRVRLQAPLLLGSAVAAVDAGHELTPDVLRLAHTVPTWLPIAATGAMLLWAGATYEARLGNLKRLRNAVSAMR